MRTQGIAQGHHAPDIQRPGRQRNKSEGESEAQWDYRERLAQDLACREPGQNSQQHPGAIAERNPNQDEQKLAHRERDPCQGEQCLRGAHMDGNQVGLPPWCVRPR